MADAEAPLADPLMSIGVFSAATLISIKALRLYHEQGLLIPAAIDPATGYRSYRVSQIGDAHVVKRLRDLGVSLADVGEIVRARDPEVTRKIVAEHERTMRQRLVDLTRLIDEAQRTVAHPASQTPVFVRHEAAQHVLAIAEVVDGPGHDAYAAFLGSAYPRIGQTIERLGAVACGPSGALYPPKVEGDAETITAFIPVSAPAVLDDAAIAAGVANLLLPEVTCAVLTHTGSYRTMSDTYGPLAAWVVTHARPADLEVREHYVVSTDSATGGLLPDDELRTEIAWPVEPDSVPN
jgi:DNA-binding transcriptional MerR regulator